MLSRSEFKTNQITHQANVNASTEQAIAEFKAGAITINELWKRGSFERAGYWFDLCGCLTLKNGEVTSGKVVRIMSNWEHIGFQIDGNSIVAPYRVVYYTGAGERVQVERIWQHFLWSHQIIEKLFNLEFIDLVREHGSKFLNRKMDRIMRSLANRYPQLDLTSETVKLNA